MPDGKMNQSAGSFSVFLRSHRGTGVIFGVTALFQIPSSRFVESLGLQFLRGHGLFTGCSNGEDHHFILPNGEKGSEFSLRVNREQKMS